MSEAVYERIKKNLEILNMKNTLMILDNYLKKRFMIKPILLKFWIIYWLKKQRQRKIGLLKTRSKCQVFLTEKLWSSLTLTFSQASTKNRLWNWQQCVLLKIKRM